VKLRILCATLIALSLSSFSRADSLLVSYSSANGGGIQKFSLTPQSSGTLFASDTAAINTLTVAGNTAYWATTTQIWADGLTDLTGGTGKSALPSVPFAGVSITDLAVSPIDNTYFVAWDAPGFGWFLADYPLSPTSSTFTIFSNDSHPVKGVTIAGNRVYWIDGGNVFSENVDGTGRTTVQTFDPAAVTLNDLAVDPVTQTYIVSAISSGLPPLLAQYPLTPQASGVIFTFGTNDIPGVVISGDRVFWIDGSNIWSKNINGTDLTLQESLPSDLTLTDLAIAQDEPLTAVPEPASVGMFAMGLFAAALLGWHTRRTRTLPCSHQS
jgi:hypothetical protein